MLRWKVDAIGERAVDAAAGDRQAAERSIEPHANLGMLDPDIGNGRVVQRASNTIVLQTVDAVGNLALNGKVRQLDVGTGTSIIGIVSINANAGAVVDVIAVAAAGRSTGEDRIPRTRARQGDIVDEDVAGDQVGTLWNPDAFLLATPALTAFWMAVVESFAPVGSALYDGSVTEM